MTKFLMLFMLVSLLAACSISGKLSRKYEGKGVETLYREFGEPKNTLILENGNRLLVFEKEVYVKETVISTGRMTLDQRVSPSFVKVEVSRFEVDNKGVVVRTEFEKRIE
jgi:hypothetical protein